MSWGRIFKEIQSFQENLYKIFDSVLEIQKLNQKKETSLNTRINQNTETA